MGCHTWCSVSLPEKQRDWRKQLLETVKTTLLDLKNDIADTTSLRNCSEEYSKHYIDTIKFCEDKIKESTDQNMINRLQTELEHSKIELEAWKLENLIKDTKDRVTKIETFLDNFQETYLDSPKDFENWWKTGEDLVDTYVFFELGDIIVKDGKIYKETYRLVENDEIDNTLGGIHDGAASHAVNLGFLNKHFHHFMRCHHTHTIVGIHHHGGGSLLDNIDLGNRQ